MSDRAWLTVDRWARRLGHTVNNRLWQDEVCEWLEILPRDWDAVWERERAASLVTWERLRAEGATRWSGFDAVRALVIGIWRAPHEARVFEALNSPRHRGRVGVE